MTSYFSAPRLYEGESAVLIASGASLSDEDVAFVREQKAQGKCRIFVCNNNYLKVPEADVLFFCDKTFWVWHVLKKEFQDFKGTKITLSTEIGEPDINIMNLGMTTGLSFLQDTLRTGGNSGYMQINLAFLYGIKRVYLLGYEMQPKTVKQEDGTEKKITHWFGAHPQATDPAFYPQVLPNFGTMIPDMKGRGIDVINCSTNTAIKCFPMMGIREAFNYYEV